MTPIENCTFRMKPSLTELTENISSRYKYFRKLRIIYSQLYDVAFVINSTYGFSLLCGIFWMSIGSLSGANSLIERKYTAFRLHNLAIVLLFSYLVALLIIITVSCSLAVNECNRSPVIVQKIMLRDDIDSELMKELEKMFTQFKIMKIGFSACGMYKIDLPLFCDIIGGTLSYVIILSQL
jgi:cytochrome bd-type quinol oxidase subunit 1